MGILRSVFKNAMIYEAHSTLETVRRLLVRKITFCYVFIQRAHSNQIECSKFICAIIELVILIS